MENANYVTVRPALAFGAAMLLGFLVGVVAMLVVIEFGPRSASPNGHLEIDLVPIPHVQPKPARPKGDTGEMVKPSIHA